jgi:hypothetical protein
MPDKSITFVLLPNYCFSSVFWMMGKSVLLLGFDGESAGARTQDQRLKRAMLYQLSYALIPLDLRLAHWTVQVRAGFSLTARNVPCNFRGLERGPSPNSRKTAKIAHFVHKAVIQKGEKPLYLLGQ